MTRLTSTFLIILFLIVLAADLLDRKELNFWRGEAKDNKRVTEFYTSLYKEAVESNARLQKENKELKIELKMKWGVK